MLGDLATQVVVPLGRAATVEGKLAQRLTPELGVDGETMVMFTPELAAVPASTLRKRVANLDAHRDAIRHLLAAELEDVIAAAQDQLEADETAEVMALAELAAQGRYVVRWCPPGPSRPVCARCHQTDQWYQSVLTGGVQCACEW